MVQPIKNRRPPWDEFVEATTSVAGERLLICSCCMGWGRNKRLFGFAQCMQCDGTGYDIIGPVGREAVKIYRAQYER
jgi:hypothetical protein